MKPGATNAPPASTTVSPSGASPGASSTITPSRTRTSASRAGAPVPSTTVPPRTKRFPDTGRGVPVMGETLTGFGEGHLRRPEATTEVAGQGPSERRRVDQQAVEVVGADLPHRHGRDCLDPRAVGAPTEHIGIAEDRAGADHPDRPTLGEDR